MAMSSHQPGNLHLLPSFVSQDLQPDGGHLTPVSGLHYILHLFDQTESILALHQCNSEIKLTAVQESVRQHDDRLSYLESRHKGLHDVVNVKVATDAEFRDWTLNRNEEDWLTILGAPRLNGKLKPREWQVEARKMVHDMIKAVLRAHCVKLEFSVLYVANPVRGRTTGMTVLNVRLNSVEASKRVRDLYSGFFRKEDPVTLPPQFRGVSIRNKTTLATRIRIRILRELGNIFVASNPGSSFTVKGYDPRPLLITTPARGSSDRQRTYGFVEAATTLPAHFSDEALASIFQAVGTHAEGELRSLFIVINDDERERCLQLVKESLKKRSRPRSSGPGAAVSAPISTSGVVAGPGAGISLESRFLESLRSAPPPPPPSSPVPEPPHRRKSGHPEPPSRAESEKDTSRKRAESDKDTSRKREKRSRRSTSESSQSESSDHERRRRGRKGKKKRSRRSSSSSGSSSSPGPSSRSKHR